MVKYFRNIANCAKQFSSVPDPVQWIRIRWIRTLINWPPGSGSRP
jgi:hypothetical protein